MSPALAHGGGSKAASQKEAIFAPVLWMPGVRFGVGDLRRSDEATGVGEALAGENPVPGACGCRLVQYELRGFQGQGGHGGRLAGTGTGWRRFRAGAAG